MGIDIFFLIFGYFIIQSLETNKNDAFINSYSYFINKRLKRILPCSCIVLLSYLIYRIYENNINPVMFNDIYYSALFFSNQYFMSIKEDYFSSLHPSCILNYWSLSVEFQYSIYSKDSINYHHNNLIFPKIILNFYFYFLKQNKSIKIYISL